MASPASAAAAGILRWTVGDFTVTSVPESEAKTTPRFLFSDLDKKGLLRLADDHPWLRPHFVSPDGFMVQKIQALVVDTGSARICVDTCIGNDKKRSTPGWSNLQTPFLKKMEEAGYPPESITYVVCTHLHVDHVGWNTRLVGGKWVPTFPNARYLFVRPEYAHWASTETQSYDGENILQPILDAGLADLVPIDHVVMDGVRLEPTVGHTPGHVSVVLESRGRRAVITGDMIHSPLQIAEPARSSALDWERAMSAATRRAFLEKFADGESLVIGTHFGTPTAGRLRANAGARKPSWILDVGPWPAKEEGGNRL